MRDPSYRRSPPHSTAHMLEHIGPLSQQMDCRETCDWVVVRHRESDGSRAVAVCEKIPNFEDVQRTHTGTRSPSRASQICEVPPLVLPDSDRLEVDDLVGRWSSVDDRMREVSEEMRHTLLIVPATQTRHNPCPWSIQCFELLLLNIGSFTHNQLQTSLQGPP